MTAATRVKVTTAAVLLVLGLTPRAASATAISFLGFDQFRKASVSVYLAGYNNNNFKVVTGGEIEWQGGPPFYNATFYGYCVDLTTAITAVEQVEIKSTNLLTVSGVPDAGGKAAWLFNTYAPVVNSLSVNDLDPVVQEAKRQAAAIQGAALQIAIWEALYDTSASLNSASGGNFRMNATTSTTTAILNQAMTYLTALYSGGGNGYQTASATWLDAGLGWGQDQMVQMPTPEPASLVLCAIGLIGLASAARRRRRTRAVPADVPLN